MVAVGAKLGKGWRTEFEYAYRRVNYNILVNNFKFSDGNIDTHSLMANLAYDMRMRRFSPYAGVGIGWAWKEEADLEITRGFFSGLKIKNSDNNFAYQGLAGIRYKVTRKFGVLAGYRYFGIKQHHRADDITVHNFELGARLFF